ncbi:hypothetical protein Ade02nite_43700 [Paractinoplanes deccanensis]|uniref:Uncharacterized protein n=1 Tax=Paractinoplanes deccanensis TaxID=113561 RepID=A0ABQ3Y6V8_9ACTN|nr:hypothetical protein Ade02nite_43700 [Actinoplanes deccanensis]
MGGREMLGITDTSSPVSVSASSVITTFDLPIKDADGDESIDPSPCTLLVTGPPVISQPVPIRRLHPAETATGPVASATGPVRS